jgi:hypothetical protein
VHPLLLAAAFSTAFVLQDPTRIAGASNVRIRATPIDSAALVATIPLGAPLFELETGGESGSWVRVRLADGRDGWIPSRLTRKVTAESKWAVTEALIKERLGRQGDSFAAHVELVELIESIRPALSDAEASGRAGLYWLQAVSNALSIIPRSQMRAEPYASWVAARKHVVVYNEPGGRWILRQEAVADLHRREQDSSSADDIAWFAARLGLAGECEGFLPCYVRRANALDGEYLRRHPAGRHVSESVSAIASAATRWPQTGQGIFDRSRDCAELIASLDSLRAAVAATRTDARATALEALDALRRPCGSR